MDYGPVCCEHLEFMQWADGLQLSALSALEEDKLLHDRGSSFRSLLDTLTHIYLAELIWLTKVTVNPDAMLADLPVPPDLPALASAWANVHAQWRDWARPRKAEDWAQTLALKSKMFGQMEVPYWQIVLHVVNHGSYHRGQLATMLRQAGVTPPATDLMLFYRSKK